MDVVKTIMRPDGSKVIVYSNRMRVTVSADGSRSRPYFGLDMLKRIKLPENATQKILEMHGCVPK